MSWHCTCSIAWHLVGLLHGYGKCRTVAAWQEKENPQRQKRKKKKMASVRSIAVTFGSSWQHCQSLVFLPRPIRERHLFYYQQRKRSPPSTKSLVFLWRRRRLSGGKQSGGNTEEKVLARSDPMFGGRCARRGRSLSLKLDKICALDVLRSLIYHSCLPFSLADPEVCLCPVRPKGLGQ